MAPKVKIEKEELRNSQIKRQQSCRGHGRSQMEFGNEDLIAGPDSGPNLSHFPAFLIHFFMSAHYIASHAEAFGGGGSHGRPRRSLGVGG